MCRTDAKLNCHVFLLVEHSAEDGQVLSIVMAGRD